MSERFCSTSWEMARAEACAAEQLTRRFYGIPGWEWERHPHDIVPRPLAHPTARGLARLVRLEVDSSSRRRPLKLYRIEVDDAAVMRAVRPERGIRLRPLLRYVFAHEYVHVVRFALLGLDYDQDPDRRGEEESRVHRLAGLVLSQAADPEVDPVLFAYQRAAGGPTEKGFTPCPTSRTRKSTS